MTVEQLSVLVEERSMEALLSELIPRVLGDDIGFRLHAFNGKPDLLAKLPARLRAYAKWLPESHRIMVVVDQDDDDCQQLKSRLESMATESGLKTKTNAGAASWQLVNRIAVTELEAWYFGDWEAVAAAFPRVPASISGRAAFRDPDAVLGGTWEAFERIVQRAGYFRGGLRKIEAARAIAPHMDLARNSSLSFQALITAISESGHR